MPVIVSRPWASVGLPSVRIAAVQGVPRHFIESGGTPANALKDPPISTALTVLLLNESRKVGVTA
jgi:hypothetical protein